jgi:hypothetical protein
MGLEHDPEEHDPEKWEPVFGQDHAQKNKLLNLATSGRD